MDPVGLAIRVALALILTTSAVSKLNSPRSFQGVLRNLGIRQVRAVWLATCGAELLIAALAIAMRGTAIPGVLVISLGFIFALAGLAAMRSGRSIQCACFGAAHSRPLGRPQLIALPLWIAAGTAMLISRADTADTAALIALVLLLATVWHLKPLIQSMRDAREDRIAVSEVAA